MKTLFWFCLVELKINTKKDKQKVWTFQELTESTDLHAFTFRIYNNK